MIAEKIYAANRAISAKDLKLVLLSSCDAFAEFSVQRPFELYVRLLDDFFGDGGWSWSYEILPFNSWGVVRIGLRVEDADGSAFGVGSALFRPFVLGSLSGAMEVAFGIAALSLGIGVLPDVPDYFVISLRPGEADLVRSGDYFSIDSIYPFTVVDPGGEVRYGTEQNLVA